MAKKGGSETVTQGLDPQSQAYVNRMRLMASQGAEGVMNGGPMIMGPDGRPINEQIAPYMNMYQQGVVDPTRAEFDYLRGQASRGVTDQALQVGAYGGSRHGVAEGVRLGALDRSQATTIADLMRQGYDSALSVGLPHIEQQRALQERKLQEPFMRSLQALGLMGSGMGPTGTVQKTEKEGNLWGQLLGLALTGASFIPGPHQPFTIAGSMANQSRGRNEEYV